MNKSFKQHQQQALAAIRIGRLTVQLPASNGQRLANGPRAERIARLLERELARTPFERDLQLSELRLPALPFKSAESDPALARRIAHCLAAAIRSLSQGQPSAVVKRSISYGR